MSNDVVSISEMLKEAHLEEYASSQYKLIESLKKEKDILLEKVAHLEQMLQSRVIPQALPLSDEEIICIEQLNILKSLSTKRELSLDEVKRLDLLIKNLRLIREQSTQVIDSTDYSNMKEADLVAALNSPKQTNI